MKGQSPERLKMASFVRKIMRNFARRGAKRQALNGAPAVGARRAGMHQKSEHDYQRSRMAESEPVPETAENALDMPGAIETEIPPVEEEDDEEVAAIAEGEAVVEAETEILDEIADPEASVNEEEESATVIDNLSVHRSCMAADYSTERIPVMTPPVSDPVPADTPLVYDSGDGSLKEIQEPLPGMGEKYGVAPVINGMIDPSANVAAYEEPEPEPEPDPEPDPDPDPVDPPADGGE